MSKKTIEKIKCSVDGFFIFNNKEKLSIFAKNNLKIIQSKKVIKAFKGFYKEANKQIIGSKNVKMIIEKNRFMANLLFDKFRKSCYLLVCSK